MTTLNEEELRKAFDYFISRSPSPLVAMIDQEDAFIGFKAAFVPEVLNSLGIVICDNNEVGFQAFDKEWEPILYKNDWTADNHGTKARPVFSIKEPK